MTASKFSTLQTFASELNTTGGISVSPYVQQITDDVIFGNSANATWNGGAATATRLGNLTAASTQTQADELIGEWFLGTNLPSVNLAQLGQENLGPTYQNSTLPLYGSSGAPTIQDVNQGYLGDCYFVSSLGEVALQDPSAIENMISSNGNGTYSVRFFVNGQPDYVTVNSQLPVMTGYQWANGSRLEFANGKTDDWVGLVEKAYAQLNAQTAAPHGMELNTASDSYAGIAAGNGFALTLVTDQPETATALYSSEFHERAGLDPPEPRLELQRRRRGPDVDAREFQRQSGRRPHVHGHRRQRDDRRPHNPQPLEHRLQRLAFDELHRNHAAACRQQLHALGHQRPSVRLTFHPSAPRNSDAARHGPRPAPLQGAAPPIAWRRPANP